MPGSRDSRAPDRLPAQFLKRRPHVLEGADAAGPQHRGEDLLLAGGDRVDGGAPGRVLRRSGREVDVTGGEEGAYAVEAGAAVDQVPVLADGVERARSCTGVR